MLKNFNLTAKDVVYFEHNPEAVKSAESAGVEGIEPPVWDLESHGLPLTDTPKMIWQA